MAIINQVMVEVLNVAERGLGLQARQVPTSVASSPSLTLLTPTPSQSRPSGGDGGSSSGGGGGGGGPTSSPLLFFVALGFGVVFTNLWIIVGVKYCFRYNARNRALRAAEDGDPINMNNIPTRPHRRRREKKLMTMDEVNERFPLMKYKAWVASRAREGLPTSGGIAAAPGSRPASLRNVDGIAMPSSPVDTKHSIEDRPATAASDRDSAEIKEISRHVPGDDAHGQRHPEKGASSQVEESTQLKQVETTATAIHKQTTTGSEEDDEDDHIHTAVPLELLSTPGDSCAICIDTLEDDEDIRGLACGHAFHAACIDPWLTSRRACCPLCKADYYIPKPRPEGEAADTERSSRRERRMNMPQQPPSSWTGIRGAPRLIIPVRFNPGANYSNDAGGQNTPRGTSTRSRREAREAREAATTAASQITNEPAPPAAEPGSEETAATRRWRFGNPLSRIHLGRGRQSETAEEANARPSPSQLEAGVVR